MRRFLLLDLIIYEFCIDLFLFGLLHLILYLELVFLSVCIREISCHCMLERDAKAFSHLVVLNYLSR